MIGCDPEFGLRTEEGEFVVPGEADEDYYGDDDLNEGPALGSTWEFPSQYGSSIGDDGDNAELRPKPGRTAQELVDNLHRLLFAANHYTKGQYEFLGGSAAFGVLGGHIHFDWVDKPVGKKEAIKDRLGTYRVYQTARTPEAARVKFLNLLLALPVALVEDPTERIRRVRSGYGGLIDHREQGTYGWEYRTLPSWLVSRYWASAVLELAETLNMVPLTEQNKFIADNWMGIRALSSIWDEGSDYDNNADDDYDLTETDQLTARKQLFGSVVYPMWRKLATGNPRLRGLLKPWIDTIKTDQKWLSNQDLLPQWGVASPLTSDGVFADKSAASAIHKKVKSVLDHVRPKGGVCFIPRQELMDCEIARTGRSTDPLVLRMKEFWAQDLAENSKMNFVMLSQKSPLKQIESTLKLL